MTRIIHFRRPVFKANHSLCLPVIPGGCVLTTRQPERVTCEECLRILNAPAIESEREIPDHIVLGYN